MIDFLKRFLLLGFGIATAIFTHMKLHAEAVWPWTFADHVIASLLGVLLGLLVMVGLWAIFSFLRGK